MSIMMDIVGATVILGMLIITVLNVNVNISNESYKSLTDLNTQEQVIQLGRIIEFDFYLMGYTIPRHGAVLVADSSTLQFRTNLQNIPGSVDQVMYTLGGAVTSSPNPHDRMLVRFENATKVYINYSVVRFTLSYYNRNDSLLATPVTGGWLDSIKSVKVQLNLESPVAMDTTISGGYPYATAMYKKLIYPRNL